MAANPHPPVNIGDFRRIKLWLNKGGYYEIRWADASAGYATRRESCKTKVFATAETYLLAFCDDKRRQIAVVAQAQIPTVEELCVGWLMAVTPQGKDKTARRVLAAPRRLLGRHTVPQLGGQALQNYGYQRGGGISDGTIRRELTALKTVLLWAVEEKLIKHDELPSFKKAVPPEGPPRVRFLDPAQESFFWDQAMEWGTSRDHGHPEMNAAAYRVMLFVALGLETAARREAIMDLTWDRVEFAQGAHGTIDYNKPGKRLTKKRRVTGLPISARLAPVLKAAWLKAPKDAAGRAVGRVIDTLSVRRGFERFVTTIGLPWVTPHVLRHTYASLSLIAGVPLWKVAKVMGDTAQTVDRTYAHLMPGALDDAVNQKAALRPAMAAAAEVA